MNTKIHVETPDGELLKKGPEAAAEANAGNEKADAPEAKDLLAGPKANPDPFANANLENKDKSKNAEGTGTEVTDGEAG